MGARPSRRLHAHDLNIFDTSSLDLEMGQKPGDEVNGSGVIGVFGANNQGVTDGNRDHQRKRPPI